MGRGRQEALVELATEYVMRPALATLADETHYVPGRGHLYPRVMFVGEAPGAQEEERQQPFVGRSGQWLARMARTHGLQDVPCWWTNVVKFRPPDNRDPTQAEWAASIGPLYKEVSILRPRIIVPLGSFAVRAFLPVKAITKERGKVQTMRVRGVEVQLLPMLHPSYVLRNQAVHEPLAEQDFALLARLIKETQP